MNPEDLELHTLLNELLLLHSVADKYVLAQHNLRRARYYILQHLYQTPGLTLGQLSELTLLYSASASRIVYSMEQEGLVQRQVDAQDRRQFTLSLTANGRAFYETVAASLSADIQTRFAGLEPAAKAALLADGRLLANALRTHCEWQEETAGNQR